MMRGYDLLKRFEQLTEQQRYDAVAFFLGGPGMDFEGYTDSQSRPKFPHAKYALDHFEGGLWYALNQDNWEGHDITLDEVEVLEFDEQLTIGFEPGCKVSVRNERGPEYRPAPEPLDVGAVRPPIDWTSVVLLALVVWVFVVLIRGY